MIHTKRISITVLSGVIIELLNKIAPLIIIHFAQRRLGIENFGYALFGLTVIEVAVPFIVFGYNQVGIIEGGKNPERISTLISNIFLLKTLHFFGVVGALLAFFYTVPSYQKYFSLMLPLCGLLVFTVVESFWVQAATQKMIVSNLLVGICRFLGLGAILLLIDNASDAILFAILSLATNALVNVLSAVHSLWSFGLTRPDRVELQSIARKAKPFAAVVLLTIVSDRMDVLMAEHFAGLAGAGYYAGCSRFGHSLMQIANVVVATFFSEMVVVKDRELLRSHMRMSVRILALLIAPIVVGVWFVDGDLLSFVFDDSFRSVKSLLGWSFIATTFGLLTVAFGQQVLFVLGKTQSYVRALLLGICIAFCIAYFGARDANLYAIAIAMCIGKGVSAVYVIWVACQNLRFFPYREIFYGLLPAALMALVLYLLPLTHFYTKVGAGVLIYAVGVIIFNRSTLLALWQRRNRSKIL